MKFYTAASVELAQAAVERFKQAGSDQNTQSSNQAAVRHNAFTIAGSSLKDREHLLKREEFIHT